MSLSSIREIIFQQKKYIYIIIEQNKSIKTLKIDEESKGIIFEACKLCFEAYMLINYINIQSM